jgi:peroxiredoxin
MAQLEPLKEHIEQLGAGLVYIAAEKRKGVWNPAKYLSEHPVLFPFLLDENRSVTKAYGLYHAFGHDAFRIAHPATLIVDRSGMLRYIYRGENQTDRAPVEEVLDSLRKIQDTRQQVPHA